MQALIAEARRKYHAGLLVNGVLTIDAKGIPSNADSSSKLSIGIAQGIARQLMADVQEKAVGQTAGPKVVSPFYMHLYQPSGRCEATVPKTAVQRRWDSFAIARDTCHTSL